MPALLEIDRLTRRFGPFTAVDDISFTVEQGEVLGFLGPNGAGKTTTMRMVAGYLPPSAGTARIAGFDVQDHPREIKRQLGYLPEGAPLYGEMTVDAILHFVSLARGMDTATRQQRTEYVIERLRLETVLYQQVETLSKGFKRRVGLALAIL
ncbi:MAG: ABC transporter ATP-binding protein, partial [Rhodospirillales bacterium]|nr:ABC transporter ATP-binding protein [Rhodospirillales bacterium]